MRHWIVAVFAVAATGLSACGSGPDTALRVATGSVSQFLCQGHFGSGEAAEQVYADIFAPMTGIGLMDWAMRYEVDPARRAIRTTWAGGFESRAVQDADGACSVQFGDRSVAATPAAAARDPLPPVAGDPRLAAAVERACAEWDGPPFRRTKAVVLLHDGKVIAERYAPGFDVDTPLPGFSVTKSLTNALLGILVREGRLSAGQPAPVAAWQAPDDPRRGITIDDLLRMRSGLDLGDSRTASLGSMFDPSNHTLFTAPDMARFAAGRPLRGQPGVDWSYADASTAILGRILADAVGGGAQGMRDFARRELFAPLGMTHAALGFDAAGTPVGAVHALASARDWARLGWLYANDGVVDGRRVLPEGWVAYSTTATPNAWIGYGAGFWTNHGDSYGAKRRVAMGMPADAFMARGMFGQYVVVVPSARLVVARFGTTHGEADLEGVARLAAETIAALREIN